MSGWEIAGLVIGGLLAFCGAVTTVGGAVEKIATAIKVARSPNDHQNERLDKLEERMKIVEGFCETDKRRLDNFEEGNRATQRALLALLDHGIDGNNIEQMQHAKEGLQNHLINR